MDRQQVNPMAKLEHLAKLKEGVGAWNRWRKLNRVIVPRLEEADLSGRNLRGVDFLEASLVEAKLFRADLEDSILNGADATEADFGKANLERADLRRISLFSANLAEATLNHADLTNANLGRADLTRSSLLWTNCYHADLRHTSLIVATVLGTNFQGASLANSKLTDASVGEVVFAENDLSAVLGLETVHHSGPSSIGIDTLYLSKGKIPEKFLRGCGVPEDFITYAKSLAANPIEFYSCFISYSTEDQGFADRLYADLQNKGVRCWFAPHDVQGGRKLHEQIDEAIRLHDKLLLILSPHSMESEWVKTEIAKARKREVRDPEGVLKRRALFPIRLAPFETLRDWECFDADTGKDSAREIREYFIPDFSNWKNHDSYQEAFQRLISDLKASDSKVK